MPAVEEHVFFTSFAFSRPRVEGETSPERVFKFRAPTVDQTFLLALLQSLTFKSQTDASGPHKRGV